MAGGADQRCVIATAWMSARSRLDCSAGYTPQIIIATNPTAYLLINIRKALDWIVLLKHALHSMGQSTHFSAGLIRVGMPAESTVTSTVSPIRIIDGISVVFVDLSITSWPSAFRTIYVSP